MMLFPTEQWLTAYGERLDASDALDEVSTGWGVGFDGDVRLRIEDVPLATTRLADLPTAVLADLPGGVRESVADVTLDDAPARLDDPIRSSLPPEVQDLLRQIEEKVIDGAIHAHVGLREGTVTETAVLADPGARDEGFVIRGSLTTWQQVVEGRPTVSALLTGDLTLDGDWGRILQYATMLQQLGTVAAAVDTTHLFAPPRQSMAGAVVDAAAGPTAAIHQSAERQLRRQFGDLL